MKLKKMRKLMNEHGWIETGIALWEHPDFPKFFMDGNCGTIIAKRYDHWYEGDNFYGDIENEEDLIIWMACRL